MLLLCCTSATITRHQAHGCGPAGSEYIVARTHLMIFQYITDGVVAHMFLILLWRDVLLQSSYQPGTRSAASTYHISVLPKTVVANLCQRVVGMDLYGEVASRIQKLYRDWKMAIKIAHHRISQQGFPILGNQPSISDLSCPVGHHRLSLRQSRHFPTLTYHFIVVSQTLIGFQSQTTPKG